MGGKYHVVCHECPEERVLEDREAARTLRTDHEKETDHRVSCGTIEPPAPEA